MTRESNKANFALLLGCRQRFQYSIRCIALLRIVVIDDLVNLPHIEMVRLQPGKRLLQLPHGDIFLSPVGADLGHHDRFVTLAFEC